MGVGGDVPGRPRPGLDQYALQEAEVRRKSISEWWESTPPLHPGREMGNNLIVWGRAGLLPALEEPPPHPTTTLSRHHLGAALKGR